MLSKIFSDLEIAENDLKKQDYLYQPTAFWREAAKKIKKQIEQHGIESFRSLSIPLGFFVPTYGVPGSSISKEHISKLEETLNQLAQNTKARLTLKHYLSGEQVALSDYRVFLAADDILKAPDLASFSESNVGAPVEQFCFEGRKFSRSSLNYLMGLTFLKKHLKNCESIETVLEVGGGFGTLGEILTPFGIKYIDIDIPPIHFIAQYYLSKVFSESCVSTYTSTRQKDIIDIERLPKVSVLCSWQIEKLHGVIDLFVNFISFQEMEPQVVSNYLHHVDRLRARFILLRNLREGKQVKKTAGDVGVETPTLGDDYLKMLPNYELVERNVYPFGYHTVDGFNSEILLLRRSES